jgi:hypothetical protein
MKKGGGGGEQCGGIKMENGGWRTMQRNIDGERVEANNAEEYK